MAHKKFEGTRVETAGYYYNKNVNTFADLDVGDKLPAGVGEWEFLGGKEITASQAIAELLSRHPDVDVDQMSSTTNTPVDPSTLKEYGQHGMP